MPLVRRAIEALMQQAARMCRFEALAREVI